MFKFLKSLISGRRGSDETQAVLIDSMSFPEILQLVQNLPEFIEIKQGTALTKRLYEIALYENHVSAEHRAAAVKLLKSLMQSMEASLANNPEGLAAYRKANAYMEDNVRRHGLGSLSWLIVENRIAPEDILPYVTRPEHLQLLEDFYSSLAPADRDKIRNHVEQYLHRQ